jgi:hypothetical protein
VFWAAGLGLATVLLSDLAAADKGKITVEKVEYQGYKNNLRISNGDVELIATLDVGPRIMSYRLKDGKNVFKEFTEQLGKSGEADWVGRGGHRLWVGPEDLTRTYEPDNGPVQYKETDDGVVLTQAGDSKYGIKKEMIVRLAPSGSRVTVLHRLTNTGDKETELAPWSLSMMAAGGIEIIPLPPKRPHPGAPSNAKSPEDFAANQKLVLWPYFDFKDPRWHFGHSYITLKHDAQRGPTKIGVAHQLGWVAYLNGGTLFVKRFDWHKGKHYPDGGVNLETFSNQDMQEIETLGPMVHLGPGKSVEHTERWELFGDVPAGTDAASIDKNVRAKVEGK